MLEESYLTLSQLNRSIRSLVEEWLCDDCWVVAEVAEISPPGRRHCYMQLVEKADDAVIAQARAVLWSSRAFLLEEFADATGETLKPGMEVLLRVRVRFHEVYGFSLDVSNINPVYTLGGLARRKRETLERLTAEGLLTRNRMLAFPLVPQRVALVSSPTAAGLGDFVTHLDHNPEGYVFSYALFPAAVQGSEAEESLAAALREVSERADLFDVAVLLRGGGSQVDLSCFDGYGVAAAIARCPVPVLTGIGHEKDETVADMAAHARAKTPTAAAEMLLERVRSFEIGVLAALEGATRRAGETLAARRTALDMATYRLTVGVGRQAEGMQRRLESATRRFADRVRAELGAHHEALTARAARLRYRPALALAREEERLEATGRALRRNSREALERAGSAVNAIEREARLLDPAHVLRRGFSITRCGDRVVKDAACLPAGSVLETQVARGTIVSRVEETSTDGG